MRARSVGPASTEPKSTCASSNSQNRGAGIPRKVTGAGIDRAVISSAESSGGAERDLGIRVEGVPVERALGVLRRGQIASPSLRRAPTENAYSMRSADHADWRARLAEERLEPLRSSTLRGLLDLGQVARRNAAEPQVSAALAAGRQRNARRAAGRRARAGQQSRRLRLSAVECGALLAVNGGNGVAANERAR